MIKYLRLLLLPFSALYGLVMILRNLLYDTAVFQSTKFDLPIICVGNLVVGGSGKSPVTEYLVNLMQGKRIAILSRGYGRTTKGYILADENATAQTIGDEPMQFYHKFPGVTVAVCEDRVKGITLLKQHHDVVILDDAYQHRAVAAGLNILLFEFQKLLKPQFLLPAGNLREPFWGYKRAGILLVTKAPAQIPIQHQLDCRKKFDREGRQELLFSSLAYQNLVPLFTRGSRTYNLGTVQSDHHISAGTTIFLLTGIANPLPLLQYLKSHTQAIHHHDYPDHHKFTVQNIQQLVRDFNECPAVEKIIITTEKDAQRLISNTLKELLLNLPVFYLPIKIALHEQDKVTFDQKILDYVSSTTRNR